MLERDIEKHLVARVKALGGEVRKVKWIGRRGAPDRLVMLPARIPGAVGDSTSPYGPRKIWVELKRPGGLATFPKDARERAQQREHKTLHRFGERVEVIDSIEGVEALLA